MIAFHPLADLFPLMDGHEFAALVADIREHGLRQAIVLKDGAILDGRNRYRACVEADVDPRFETYAGNDPLAYIVSLNLNRRHLSESQRAMVAAKIANMRQGERTDLASIDAKSQSDAADMLNVSRSSVQRATEVRDHGVPELQQAVEHGEVSVSAAANIAARPEDEQREILGSAHVRGTFGTGENEWYTPDLHLQAVRDVLGVIDLDPASSAIAQQRVKATAFFSRDDDGLAREWRGRIFCNPPYAQPAIAQFVSKLVAEYDSDRVTEAIMLTHNYTDTAWFHEAARASDVICFTRGRVKFIDASGNVAAPTQGQAFFYFGPNVGRFKEVFAQFGFVVSGI